MSEHRREPFGLMEGTRCAKCDETWPCEVARLHQDRGDCQMVMDGQQAEIEMLRGALQAELKFWRNQPSPYRHDERIAAIEIALNQQQPDATKP